MDWNSKIAMTQCFYKALSDPKLSLFILFSFSHLQYFLGMDRSSCTYLYKCTLVLHVQVWHTNTNIHITC